VTKSDPDFKGKAFKKVSKAAIACIKRCFEKDPAKRSSAKDLLEDKWFTQYYVKDDSGLDKAEMESIMANLKHFEHITCF